jgi:peroxiredoxin
MTLFRLKKNGLLLTVLCLLAPQIVGQKGAFGSAPQKTAAVNAGGLVEMKSEKTRVIVFLSAKCPCSASHEPALKKLHTEFSGSDFDWLGVHSNGDESAEKSEQHFKESALPFPLVEDPQQKIANQFGALKTPHVFIVKDGKVIYSGGVDDSADANRAKTFFLKSALTQIREGKNPEPAETRTLGCVIERKAE